ncbi:MAG: sulfite exporter TauE/SafE family protein [Nitrosopumilus sp.]|nr:sulfite exporter TauE/SafE family protein [Nitrosopumilus sp.]
MTVPVLSLLGFPPALAASNGLSAALGSSASAVVSGARRRGPLAPGLMLGAAAAPGAVAGAHASSAVAPPEFQILFGAVLCASAAYLVARGKMGRRRLGTPALVALGVPAGVCAGAASAFFGIGGGVIFVPFLVCAAGMRMGEAVPSSLAALMLASAAGMAAHAYLGHADAYQALLLAAGAVPGGIAGSKIAGRVRDGRLVLLAAVMMAAAAARLLYGALASP